MVEAGIILVIIGILIAGILLAPTLRHWRQHRLKRRPFPAAWQAILETQLPVYTLLSADKRRRLQGHIHVFLAEKQFIGCGGLGVTTDMKVIIAAMSCLLLLNERGDYFPKLRSILVYPSPYRVQTIRPVGPYVVEETQEARLGESWTRDHVVLAWDQVQRDIANWCDGHNVVLHEFAHQLDQAGGRADGVPILPHDSDYLCWTQVMTAEYQQLRQDVQQGVKTIMDSYGALNPAEFFAVATETFFEKPRHLLRRHPELYAQLKYYYQLDPVQWV